MPDIADDRAAFREAMRRAEENALHTDANGDPVPRETPDATPELEGAVPVQASDQPLTPEPVAEEVADTSEQQQVVVPETPAFDPQEKIAELEARLAEKDSFIGRQSTEIGDLRTAVEEIRQQTATPQQPVIAIDQNMIDTDPEQATLLAFSQGNQVALERAFSLWKEIDPFTAGQWLTDRRLEDHERKVEAKIAETQKTVDERTAPLAVEAESRAWAQAFDLAKSGRDDFLDNAARLLEEVAPLHPAFLVPLQSSDPKEKADALIALYAIDKLGNPEALTTQLNAAAAEAAAENAAAVAQAGVVSSQSTAGQPSVEQTVEQLEAEAYKSRLNSKPSLAKGWTGRS